MIRFQLSRTKLPDVRRFHAVRVNYTSLAVRLRVFAMLVVIAAASTTSAQDTPDYYRQNCMNCHTIGGGRLTGPDLKNVRQRREPEWLIGFMQNPKAVIESGDPYAVKLADEARGVVMPIAPGMTRYRAEQIIKLLETESALAKSQFEGVRIWPGQFPKLFRVGLLRV